MYILLSYEIISYVLKINWCWTSRRIKSIRHAPWYQLSSSSLHRHCHRFLDILRQHNRCPTRRHRKFRIGCHLQPPEVRLSHPAVNFWLKLSPNRQISKCFTWHESIPESLAGKAFAPMSCPYALLPTDFAWIVTWAICRAFGWFPPDDKVPHPDMMAYREEKIKTYNLFIHPKSIKLSLRLTVVPTGGFCVGKHAGSMFARFGRLKPPPPSMSNKEKSLPWVMSALL